MIITRTYAAETKEIIVTGNSILESAHQELKRVCSESSGFERLNKIFTDYKNSDAFCKMIDEQDKFCMSESITTQNYKDFSKKLKKFYSMIQNAIGEYDNLIAKVLDQSDKEESNVKSRDLYEAEVQWINRINHLEDRDFSSVVKAKPRIRKNYDLIAQKFCLRLNC